MNLVQCVLPSLEYVDLSGSFTEKLESNTFLLFVNSDDFYPSDTNLRDFVNFNYLKYLYLSGTRLSFVDLSQFDSLINLDELDISFYKLEKTLVLPNRK